MATREENIKTINEVFEKLDDEQLEEVAGGRGAGFFSGKSPEELKEEKLKAELEKWEFCKRFMAEFRLEKSKLALKKQFEEFSKQEGKFQHPVKINEELKPGEKIIL